jgi:hypothetical protein
MQRNWGAVVRIGSITKRYSTPHAALRQDSHIARASICPGVLFFKSPSLAGTVWR